jgi:hypothetical protein
LTALVAAKQGMSAGRLKLELAGIADGPAVLRRALTLGASAILMAVGLALWIRGRIRRVRSRDGEV